MMRDTEYTLKKELLSAVTANIPKYKTVVWRGTAITVRTVLTARDVSRMFDSVMAVCYDKERDLFFPEMADFAFRAGVLIWYAGAELPDDIEEQYRLVYGTNLYDTVRTAICGAQADALWRAIELCMGSMSAHMKI